MVEPYRILKRNAADKSSHVGRTVAGAASVRAYEEGLETPMINSGEVTSTTFSDSEEDKLVMVEGPARPTHRVGNATSPTVSSGVEDAPVCSATTGRTSSDDWLARKTKRKKKKAARKERRPRGAVRRTAIAGALFEYEQKLAGDADAIREEKRDLRGGDGPPAPQTISTLLNIGRFDRLVVSTTALRFAWNGRNFTWEKVPGEDGQNRYRIVGRFKVGKESVFVDQVCEEYLGVSEILGSTDCGVLYGTAGNEAQAVETRIKPREADTFGTLDERLWVSVKAVLRHVDYSGRFDKIKLSKRIEAHYCAFNPKYPTLREEITRIVESEEFAEMYRARIDHDYNMWETNTVLRLKHFYAKQGYDYDEMLKKAFWQEVGWTMLKYGVLYASKKMMKMFLGKYHNTAQDGVAYFTWALFIIMLIRTFYKVTSGNFTRSIVRRLADNASTKMSLIAPCSLMTLRTFVPPKEALVREEDLADDVKLEVKFDDGELLESKTIEIFGSVGDDVPMVIPTTSGIAGSWSTAVGCGIRLGKALPRDKSFEKEFYEFATKIIDEEFDMITIPVVSKEEQFSHLSSQYTVKRATEIMELYEDVLEPDDLWYTIFCKLEAYLGKKDYDDGPEDEHVEGFEGEGVATSDPKPRVIWSCPPVLLAKFSKEFSILSKEMGKVLSDESGCFYTNGATPLGVGDYGDRMNDYCAQIVESDVSNWDGSVTHTMLMIEKYFLENKVEGMPEEFALLLKHWGTVKGHTKDKRVFMQMEHGRRSGDLWTSSFNSLLNYLIVRFIYGKPKDEMKMMVLGDDNVVGFHTPLDHPVEHYAELYKKIGMKCVIIERESIEQATYCSGRFWRVDGVLRWGNNPFRLLAKFGINYHNHSQKNFKPLLYGTARGLLCTAGHVPIVGGVLRAICNSAELAGIKPRVDNRHLNPYRIKGGLSTYPSRDTYMQFSELYGIPYDLVIEMEEWCEHNVTINSFPCKWKGEWFHEGFMKDVGPAAPSKVEAVEMPESYYDSMEYIIEQAPKEEELYKLEGAKTLSQAIERAINMGREEDEMLGGFSHKYLHILFTTISWFHLDLGIGLHKAYNTLAMMMNYDPCALEHLHSRPIDLNVGIFSSILICLLFVCCWMGPAAKKAAKRKKKRKKARRRERRAETGLLKTIGRTLLTEGGAALGSMIPVPGASTFTRKAGAWLSKITGMGDYEVSENTLFHGQVPEFGSGKHVIRVTNREFLGDVTGSVGWQAFNYTINPAMISTFPWASRMASLYTQYRLRGMIFEFKSTSADALNSTNTALGTVIMATRYNPYDQEFTSKLEAENHEFSTSCKPSDDCIHPIECAPGISAYPIHYVRNGALGPSEDQRLYDWGVFTFATRGMQAAATIGELWVSYDIEFLKPRLNLAAYPNPLHARISNGPTDADNPLGLIQRGVGGNLPITITASGAGYDTLTFPEYIQSGRYLISWYITGATSGGTSISGYSDCALATTGYGWDIDSDWYILETTGANQPRSQLIDITGPSPTLTWVNSGTDTDTLDIYVLQMPGPDSFELITPSSSIMSVARLDDEKSTLDGFEDEEWEEYRKWRAIRKGKGAMS